MPSRGAPKFTVRMTPQQMADVRWAATVVQVEASAHARSALLALVAEAEALSGSVRPSLRGTEGSSGLASTETPDART